MLRPADDSRKPTPTIATIRPLKKSSRRADVTGAPRRRTGYRLRSLRFSDLRRRPTVTTAVSRHGSATEARHAGVNLADIAERTR